ncbi:unnamed protein product, partial [Arabidopsis halleri]
MANGCIRKKSLKCGANNFITLVQMSFPHAENALIYGTNQIQECQDICVVSCKCTIFAKHISYIVAAQNVSLRGRYFSISGVTLVE